MSTDRFVLYKNGSPVYDSGPGVVVPVDPPPPPPPLPPPTGLVDYSVFAGETREGLEYKFKHGYARMPVGWNWSDFEASGFMLNPSGKPAGDDRRNVRDLSTWNGPAIVEGYQGTVAYITIRRPVGEVVEITIAKTPSVYGFLTDAIVSANGRSAVTSGSDAHGRLFFTSTGDDQLRVELRSPGALIINRNIGDPNAVKGTP